MDTEPNMAIVLAGVLTELFIFLILGVLLAIGNAGIAGRLGKSKALWVVLSIVPGVNIIFMYYVFYQIVYGVLDRLPPLAPRQQY
jgi:hypothetical protein